MGWNIHPGSARAICDQADENIDGLNLVAEKVSSAFDAVAASAGTQTASAARDVSLDPYTIGGNAFGFNRTIYDASGDVIADRSFETYFK